MLSKQLSADYGDGFSVSALRYMRLFFQGYPKLLKTRRTAHVPADTAPAIHHALRDELAADGTWRPGLLNPGLSWTHYRTLLKVERRPVRDFYEIEAVALPRPQAHAASHWTYTLPACPHHTSSGR
jgi:hypothetical protein